jgi:seryl-tRNA synthetase
MRNGTAPDESSKLMSETAKDRLHSMTHALFLQSGHGGVNAGTGLFEQAIDGLTVFINRLREPDSEVLRFPPIMSRGQIEKAGYLHSFPHLLGCVSCLDGNEMDIRALVERRNSGNQWVSALAPTELVLTPAACYPVYPLAASRGNVPENGLKFDVASYCFRRESTYEPGRLQAFRMREFVCIGNPDQAFDFRSRWLSRAEELARRLGLPHKIAPASDPFFGRVGKLAAMMQIEQALKFELLIPVNSEEEPTACMSFNCHREHFGEIWGLHTQDSETAHTACVAFGLDRLALALFATHGIDLRTWPALVRDTLSM